MGAEGLFQAVRDAHGSDPEVSEGRMFGSSGLKVGGKVFAMLVKERLVVKLPEARVDELIGSGTAIRFDPGRGRPMREWAAMDASTTGDWVALASEARSFVASGR